MTIGHTLHGQGSQGVLVFHGWFGDHKVYEPMFPHLDTDSFTYAFVDQRGYGKSINQTGDYTIEEISNDGLELANELGWGQFHVIGHSMGGKVVQRIAMDAGDRVKSAIACNPVPASGVPMSDEEWPLFGGAPDNDENRFQIVDFTTGGRLPRKWVQSIVTASRETTTLEAFRGYLEAWVKGNFVEQAMGLATPMKVIVGEHDAALTAEVMKMTFMEWYPNASLEVLAGAGHYPMQEVPVYLAATMDAFLREHS